MTHTCLLSYHMHLWSTWAIWSLFLMWRQAHSKNSGMNFIPKEYEAHLKVLMIDKLLVLNNGEIIKALMISPLFSTNNLSIINTWLRLQLDLTILVENVYSILFLVTLLTVNSLFCCCRTDKKLFSNGHQTAIVQFNSETFTPFKILAPQHSVTKNTSSCWCSKISTSHSQGSSKQMHEQLWWDMSMSIGWNTCSGSKWVVVNYNFLWCNLHFSKSKNITAKIMYNRCQ